MSNRGTGLGSESRARDGEAGAEVKLIQPSLPICLKPHKFYTLNNKYWRPSNACVGLVTLRVCGEPKCHPWQRRINRLAVPAEQGDPIAARREKLCDTRLPPDTAAQI